MIRVTFTIDAPEELLAEGALGDGALVRLERAATAAGSYAEITTIALDAEQQVYTFWDPAGTDTSWYRWRVSNELNDDQTGYSDPFQGDDVADPALPGTYASLADVVESYQQDLDDKTKARILDALRDATQQIIDILGFDFFRHPTSGTETFIIGSDRRRRVCLHDGITSLTTVELRLTETADWEELEAADWELEGPEKPGHPSFHLRLTGVRTWSHFPRGEALVRLTGAKGWPAVPRSARRACRDRARQLLAWDATRPGGPVGPEELGASPGPNRMPDTMYRLRHDYSAWELGLAQCEL